MAVFTSISLDQARTVAEAHGLAPPDALDPIPAGSVNSNFFLVAGDKRWFLRIYEEQGADGVAYEWALLDHLRAAGLPVPARVHGPAPGEISIAGKPVAIFEPIGGRMSCQAAVSPGRAAAVGRILARAHRASDDFPLRRAGRFTLDAVGSRLDTLDLAAHPDLAATTATLREALAEGRAGLSADLPAGVVHGDLFRDNVHFEGDRIVAVIDWESASDGARVYDLAVALLAWCYGDELDWPLARALCRGYEEVRPLAASERLGLHASCIAAATRFATTRITDFHLRSGIGERVHKDYRRFLARLSAIRALGPEDLSARLLDR